MPIYEYECNKGHRFEQYNPINNRHNALCPTCDSKSNLKISKPNMRVAYPVRWISAEGKEIAWRPDGGISPPAGQPYPVEV